MVLSVRDIVEIFLQIGIKSEDRDVFRILFKIARERRTSKNYQNPFSDGEASPFNLGGILQRHYGAWHLVTQSLPIL